MSVGSDKDDVKPVSEAKGLDVTIGSHYALQVALQTMKERCQQLQQRLVAVEGENLSLRVEKEKNNFCNNTKESERKDGTEGTKNDVEELQQQVTQLVRQKSQLTHHIFMVANENKQLWSRLSRLTQANKSLGSHLTKISDTLNQHPGSSSSSPNPVTLASSNRESFEGEATDSRDRILSGDAEIRSNTLEDQVNLLETISNNKTSGDSKEESLEEISLKLIKSFLQEKSDLEQQYAQMVEIQTDCPSFSVPDLGFTYEEEGDESIVDEVKQHCERLQCMRETLREQHTALKAAVSNMEKIKNGGVMCQHCQERARIKMTEAETMEVEMESLRSWAAGATQGSYSEDIQKQLSQVAEPPNNNSGGGIGANSSSSTNRRGSSGVPRRLTERSASFNTTSIHDLPPQDNWMCPLCSCIYPKSCSFDDFHKHVMGHFAEEDDLDSITDNFELVPNDLGAH